MQTGITIDPVKGFQETSIPLNATMTTKCIVAHNMENILVLFNGVLFLVMFRHRTVFTSLTLSIEVS